MLSACADTGAAGLTAARTLAGAAGVLGMIGGQTLDLEAEARPVDEPALLEIYRMKTGALIAAACKMGCALAGAPEERCALAEAYGYKLGLAFQIVDDLLDVYGDAATLGKPTGSDWDNQKTTFASLHSRPEAERISAQVTEEALALIGQCGFSDGFLCELTQRLLHRIR